MKITDDCNLFICLVKAARRHGLNTPRRDSGPLCPEGFDILFCWFLIKKKSKKFVVADEKLIFAAGKGIVDEL